MKNKQLAQLALLILVSIFCMGFYSGITNTPMGGILTAASFVSVFMQVWVISRLWSARDES